MRRNIEDWRFEEAWKPLYQNKASTCNHKGCNTLALKSSYKLYGSISLLDSKYLHFVTIIHLITAFRLVFKDYVFCYTRQLLVGCDVSLPVLHIIFSCCTGTMTPTLWAVWMCDRYLLKNVSARQIKKSKYFLIFQYFFQRHPNFISNFYSNFYSLFFFCDFHVNFQIRFAWCKKRYLRVSVTRFCWMLMKLIVQINIFDIATLIC